MYTNAAARGGEEREMSELDRPMCRLEAQAKSYESSIHRCAGRKPRESDKTKDVREMI